MKQETGTPQICGIDGGDVEDDQIWKPNKLSSYIFQFNIFVQPASQ
jgi:hypothetical protein